MQSVILRALALMMVCGLLFSGQAMAKSFPMSPEKGSPHLVPGGASPAMTQEEEEDIQMAPPRLGKESGMDSLRPAGSPDGTIGKIDKSSPLLAPGSPSIDSGVRGTP
jgi:hypothetical protein